MTSLIKLNIQRYLGMLAAMHACCAISSDYYLQRHCAEVTYAITTIICSLQRYYCAAFVTANTCRVRLSSPDPPASFHSCADVEDKQLTGWKVPYHNKLLEDRFLLKSAGAWFEQKKAQLIHLLFSKSHHSYFHRLHMLYFR